MSGKRTPTATTYSGRRTPAFPNMSEDDLEHLLIYADDPDDKELAAAVKKELGFRYEEKKLQAQEKAKSSSPSAESERQASAPESGFKEWLMNTPDAARAAGRGLYQGALFNFGDELAGGAAGLQSLLSAPFTGQSDPKTQAAIAAQDEMNAIRDLNSQSEEEHPTAYLGGELLGSLAGTGAIKGLGRAWKAGKATFEGTKALSAMKMLQAEEAARKALPLLKRLGLGALEGSGFGALYGLGSSEGTPIKSTAFGTLGGALGGTVGEALSGPLSKLTGGTRQQNLLKSLGASDEAIEKMAKGDYASLSDYLTKSQEANAVAQEQAKKILSEEAMKKSALRGTPSDYPELVRRNVEPEFAQAMDKVTDETSKKLLELQPTPPIVNDLKLRLLNPEEISSVVSGKNPAAAAAVTPTKERIQKYITDLANDVETLQVPVEGGTKKAFPLSLFRSPEGTAELAAQANEALKGAAPRESQVAEAVHQLAKGYTGNRTPGPFARFMQKLTKDLPVASGLTELASTEAFPRSNAAAYLAKTFAPPLSYPVGIAGAEQAQSLVPTGLEMLQNYLNTPRALSPEETQRLEDERKEKSKKSFIQQQTDAGSQYGEP